MDDEDDVVASGWEAARMITKRNLFFDPPAIIIQDESATYRRQLKQNHDRQAMRDLEADAHIENAFFGVPYKSMVDEYPLLEEALGFNKR